MSLDHTTFDYLSPTQEQVGKMNTLRAAAKMYAHVLDAHLPEGPDKTYLLRKLREVAMWANVAVTRHSTGAPRTDGEVEPNYPPSHPAPGDLGSVPL